MAAAAGREPVRRAGARPPSCRRSARWNCSTPPGGPHSAIRKLDALIRVALEENKDLRIAALRVEQYNAQLQVAQAEGGPQAVARAQRTRDSVSQNRFIPLVVGGAYPVGNTYEIGAGVTWEIDFWGRVRRANEAALADLIATEEDRRALVLSLVANVASTYVTLLGLDRELELHRLDAASRNESVQLLGKKLEGGGVGEQPYLKAKAEYEEALAELTVKEAEITVLEHALSSLLGRSPGRIERGKTLAALNLPPIPAGLPADLLVQRPDVRKAEQELVSANARIGIAKAQYLPTIGLTAQYGFASAELNTLLQSSSNVSSFGAMLSRADLHQRADRRPGARGRGDPAAEGDGLPAERADGACARSRTHSCCIARRGSARRSGPPARSSAGARQERAEALRRRPQQLPRGAGRRPRHLRRRGSAEPDPPRPVHRADFRLQGHGRRLERQRFPACRPHREGEDK